MGSWITTHFVNPGMLAGLGLVAAPIIIWLLHRFRFKTIDWAAQTFLLRALKRSQRRLRLENLLLLLIRCLLIALFVIAVSRPRGQPLVASDPNDARRNVVILIDTSYSTGYQVGSDAAESVFERERRAAKDLVRHLKPVDRFAVIAFDDVARVVYPTPRTADERGKKDLQDDLESMPELQRTARSTDYGCAIQALPGLLRRFDLSPDGQPPPPGTPPSAKNVFLLSDGQRSGLFDATGKLRDPNCRSAAEALKSLGATLHVVDCGPEEPKNVSVTLLDTRDPIVGTDMPCVVEAAVRNWSASRVRGLTLEFFVDGAETPAKAQTLELEAGELKTAEPLRYVFHEKGPHRVLCRLKSDALVVDNERAIVIDVREAVRVLLVDGDPRPGKYESETDFLRKALEPFGGAAGDARDAEKDIFRCEVIGEAQLNPARLRAARNEDGYSVVVVANVVSLQDEQVAALETFARDGGAVLFTAGGLVDRTAWNERLWRGGRGLLPCRLGEVRGPASSERTGARDPNAPEWVLGLADREHPVLRIYAEQEMRAALRGPSVFRYVEALELGTGPAAATAPLRLVPRPRADDANARPTPEDERLTREGAPVLVERAFGRGRAILWLTTIDDAWSNAVVYDTFFVIFWRQMCLELARGARPRKNLAIGERYERLISTAEYAPNVDVTLPDGARETSRPEQVEGREQFRVVYPAESKAGPADGGHGDHGDHGDHGTPAPAAAPPGRKLGDTGGVERPGLYEVKLTGGAGDTVPAADYFAVRVDPGEGDLTKLAAEDWKEALPGLEVRQARTEALADAFLSPGEATQGNELWGPAIAAVLLLLMLESALAAAFGRRRR